MYIYTYTQISAKTGVNNWQRLYKYNFILDMPTLLLKLIFEAFFFLLSKSTFKYCLHHRTGSSHYGFGVSVYHLYLTSII